MRKSVRRVLYRFLPSRVLVLVLLLLGRRRAGLLQAYGYARSVRFMRPVDEHDQPLPYMPYCAVELLRERLTSDLAVLEFGSGYSTLFFSQRVGSVTSIEHDQRWIDTVQARVGPKGNVLLVPRESAERYTAPVRNGNDRYDLILVDGRHRVDCFKLALQRLTTRGVIVLDDSDRPEYNEVFALAESAGFRMLHLRGHKPDSVHLHRTSFFYRDGNCLGI